jgi:hypothetical protein
LQAVRVLSCFAWLLDTQSGEIDGDVVEQARPDGLGNLSTAETSAWDSNLAELRQHIEDIGVVSLASAGQLYLSRKSVEIRTRNCLRPEGLAFFN